MLSTLDVATVVAKKKNHFHFLTLETYYFLPLHWGHMMHQQDIMKNIIIYKCTLIDDNVGWCTLTSLTVDGKLL